jgi:hypothetical protein
LHARKFAILLCVLFAGCASKTPQPYRSANGFCITPPAGWVERMHEGVLPGKGTHNRVDVPLPALDSSGKSARERLVVRYDRLTSSQHAWLRVTVIDAAAAQPLQKLAGSRTPASNWKLESSAEALEIGGRPAARAAFVGAWDGAEYICETVAIQYDTSVYLISATFPSADKEAREQVRDAVARVTWK